MRGITHAIKDGKRPFGNLSVGGEHLDHYMWGIGMLAGVGAVAVRGTEQLRRHPVTALAYGAGLALIADEFALLLDLKDVYWAKQGRISVDLAICGSALADSYFAAPAGHPQGLRQAQTAQYMTGIPHITQAALKDLGGFSELGSFRASIMDYPPTILSGSGSDHESHTPDISVNARRAIGEHVLTRVVRCDIRTELPA